MLNHTFITNALGAFWGLLFSFLLFQPFNAYSQCSNISVSVDTNVSCSPGIFIFKVINAPKGSIFRWNFGKGYVQGTDTFKMIQIDPAVLNLKLRIDFLGGDSCIKTYNKISTIRSNPEVDMSISKSTFCSTAESYTLTDITPKSAFRIWLVEGSSYTPKTKTLTGKFTSQGKKDVVLIVEDSFGCKSVKSFKEAAEVIDNKSFDIISSQSKFCENSKTNYSLNTKLVSSELQSIKWSFPGASPNTSSLISPNNISYPNSGKYNVLVEIKTKKGCTYNIQKNAIVEVVKPKSLSVQISDTFMCMPDEVKIQIKDTGLYGKLDWMVTGSILYDSFSPTYRKYYYNEAGVHNLQIIYTDSFCTSVYTKNKYLTTSKVSATFSAQHYYDCEVPFLAEFKNTSESSDPGTLKYSWMVYDTMGNVKDSSSQKDYAYKVDSMGIYDLELLVTHPNGCSGIAYHTKFIRADSIRIDFIPTPKYACIDQTVTLLNNSFPSTYKAQDQFFWWLYKSGDTIAIDSSDANQPYFNAKYSGKYDIKAKAWNSVGCSQELFREEALEVVQPKADFITSYDTVCRGIEFGIKSQNYPAVGEFHQTWRLTSGNDTIRILGASDPLLTILKPGVYDIRYNISIYGECADTALKKGALVVSGIEAEVELPTLITCRNVKFKPVAKTVNSVYGNTGKQIDYDWRVYPQTGVSFSNNNSANPEVIFTQNGTYVFRLIVRNANSCLDTTFSDTLTVGLNPNFVLSDSAVCGGKDVYIENKTNGFANRFFYATSPATTLDITDLGKGSAILNIAKNGAYTLHLIASKDSICFDTFSTKLNVIKPQASFLTLDSNLYCAPVYQRFRSTSTNTDTMFWDFGDGKKLMSTDPRVTTVYLQNTGTIQPYSVQLIAKHRSGCADTVIAKDLVKISGPTVKFQLQNNRGCEPLMVNIVGQTENVAKMFIDYGDGGDFGFDLNQPRAYKNSWRIIEQEYQPIILVVDKYGCINAIKSDSSVFVKPSPTARMGIIDTISCAPLKTKYYYLGKDATSWFWDFDGNGIADGNNASGNYTYNQAGNYPLTLINENSFKCTDTAITQVKSVAPPKVKIGIDSILCVNKSLKFKDLTTYDLPGMSRNWRITASGTNYNTKDSVFDFVSGMVGNLTAQLNITDILGCSDTHILSLFIRDSANTQAPTLDVVSVNQDSFVDVNYQKGPTGYKYTSIFRSTFNGSLIVELSSQPAHTTSLIDSFGNATNGSVCYEINHTDSCGYVSPQSNRHCTIYLQTTSTVNNSVDLSWTPYYGWDDVDEYQIFKQKNGQFVLYATVPGYLVSYRDSGLCASNYCYFIKAINSSQNIFSNSNTSCTTALYSGNSTPTSIQNVTVIDNNHIEIKIDDSADLNKYMLYRHTGIGASKSIPTNDKIYEDFEVDVHSKSYSYSVQAFDHCNNIGQPGDTGKSILLSVESSNQLKFNWTPYKDWPAGIDNYTIYRNEKGSFLPLVKLSGSDTNTTVNYTSEISASNCFMVVASSADGQNSSASNIVCVKSEPIVFIPNAFDPNSHHGNNEFKPYMLFIKSPLDYDDGVYDLVIYNSWGEIIFESHDPSEGWDGVYNGTDSPMGTYLYTMRVRGLDDKFKNFSGTFLLIR